MDHTNIANSMLQPKESCLKTSENNLANLFPAFYQELKCLAHNQLRKTWSIDTIQTTALLNETFLKLQASFSPIRVNDKQHFFGLCAKAMRQILINYSEHKQAKKRGGDAILVTYAEKLQQADMYGSQSLDLLLDVDKALDKVGKIDEKLAELVELKFFAGFTEAELAQIYCVNERTIRRNWKKAKTLLALTLEPEA